MSVIAIIPARGQSSLRKKNIRLLAGKPLIAYTIETALNCPSIDRVIVSTDDEEIATVARKYRGEVPFIRPKELAMADTPMLPVLQHTVAFLEDCDEKIDIVVLLDPTAPLRSIDDVESCIKKLKETKADSVVSVCEAEHNPYFVMVQLDGDRMVPLIKPEKPILRRQDAPKVYRINAAVYAIRRDVLMEKNQIFTETTLAVVMPPERSVHIDHELDFKLAESILRK